MCMVTEMFSTVVVRYQSFGNRSKKELNHGTHPEITRYFMSIGEAVRLVIQSGSMAKGGEVFL